MNTTRSSEKLALKALKADNNKIVDGNGAKANETFVNLSKNNKSRKLTHILNIRAMEKPIFLTFDAKKAFNYL